MRFLCALILVFSLLGCQQKVETPAQETGDGPKERSSGASIALEVNSKAPAFAAKIIGGGELRLSDYLGQNVVILEFWSVFCKSCLEEMPFIKKLHEKYSDQGLKVISVNTDVFSDARILQALSKANISFDYPVVRDRDQAIIGAFKVEVLPVTVIIDRSGWIRLYQEGFKPGEEKTFEDVVVRLLDKKLDDDITLGANKGVTTFATKKGGLAAVGQRLDKPISMASLKGKNVNIGDGKPTLMMFWSLYCHPCREEIPLIDELSVKLARQGVTVMSVNVDNSRMRPRIDKFLSAFPNVDCFADWPDANPSNLSRIFGVSATPTTLLVGKSGEILYSHEGNLDEGELTKALLSSK